MAGFKAPSFNDRMALSQAAKQKALARFKAKPPLDEAVVAERRRAEEARQQAIADASAAKAKAIAAAKADKAKRAAALAAEREANEEAAALKASRLKPATAEEMKAARDARYAARKGRK